MTKQALVTSDVISDRKPIAFCSKKSNNGLFLNFYMSLSGFLLKNKKTRDLQVELEKTNKPLLANPPTFLRKPTCN